MSGRGSSSRIWVGLTAIFFITTLAGAIYIAYINTRPALTPEQKIIFRYPSLFRNPDQQKTFQRQYFNKTFNYRPVNKTVPYGNTCLVKCGDIPRQQKGPGRQTGGTILHHACCQSSTYFQTEDHMTNVYGESKKIAQFGVMMQYFKYEECSHVPSFQYGQCQQRTEYTTAVTEDEDLPDDHEDKYTAELVEIVYGCCKCINTGG